MSRRLDWGRARPTRRYADDQPRQRGPLWAWGAVLQAMDAETDETRPTARKPPAKPGKPTRP